MKGCRRLAHVPLGCKEAVTALRPLTEPGLSDVVPGDGQGMLPGSSDIGTCHLSSPSQPRLTIAATRAGCSPPSRSWPAAHACDCFNFRAARAQIPTQKARVNDQSV